MRYLLLCLLLTSCAKSTSTITPQVWHTTNYSECQANILPNTLPYDFGVTLNRSDLPFGRYDGIYSSRPHLISSIDNSDTVIGQNLIDSSQTENMQFNGWSPDGNTMTLNWSYEDPHHAMIEEALKEIITDPLTEKGMTYQYDLSSKSLYSPTEVSPVSNINANAVYYSATLMSFSAYENGDMRNYLMSPDGSNKRPALQHSGFGYGYSVSPDGTHYSYHLDNNGSYQIWIGDMATQHEVPVNSGLFFNFGAIWSPDSSHIAFYGGSDGTSNTGSPDVYTAKSDGTEVTKLSDRDGFNGVVPFISGYDFHGGVSDYITWARDSSSIIFAGGAEDGKVELWNVSLLGSKTRLTTSNPGVWNNNPNVSRDGRYILYVSTENGPRDVWVMDLTTMTKTRVTDVGAGCNARYPKWRGNP